VRGIQRRSNWGQATVKSDSGLDSGPEIVICASGDEHVPFL